MKIILILFYTSTCYTQHIYIHVRTRRSRNYVTPPLSNRGILQLVYTISLVGVGLCVEIYVILFYYYLLLMCVCVCVCVVVWSNKFVRERKILREFTCYLITFNVCIQTVLFIFNRIILVSEWDRMVNRKEMNIGGFVKHASHKELWMFCILFTVQKYIWCTRAIVTKLFVLGCPYVRL